MATPTIFKPFNASTVPLQGTNLIEASAGTGKTYSIAILLLRIIVEQKITIKEILMVTFTKAAVAELHDRVRLFVHLAQQVSLHQPIDDENITTIINNAVQAHGLQEVQTLLTDAVTFLDEVAVLTIHSFCQQTLTEFAFETNQLFNAELTTDAQEIIETEVNNFWRNYITSIPVNILLNINKNLSRPAIVNIVKNNLDGKIYQQYDSNTQYNLNPEYFIKQQKAYDDLVAEENILYKKLLEYVADNMAIIKQKIETVSFAKKHYANFNDDADEFINLLQQKIDIGYNKKLFADIIELYIPYSNIVDKKNNFNNTIIDYIFYAAVTSVSQAVTAYKVKQNQLSFDDLINNLHTALVKKPNPALQVALQQKYKAVFIDEFQDTDKLQYEIFKTAFSSNTILFYIGDPKQSIYAWRKADIDTYFKAYTDAQHCYSMNLNFRSTALYINAMNTFFSPTENFDTFYFGQAKNKIQYIPVQAPANSSIGNVVNNKAIIAPINIQLLPKKDDISNALVAQTIALLSNKNYSITSKTGNKKIKPSDIGILVRSNKQGNEIKNNLAKYGIPAITIGDATVLDSDEALSILYLLEAIQNANRSAINKALLNNITGYTVANILLINDEVAIELFKKYNKTWQEQSVYTALQSFMKDFGVQQNLLNGNTENGERILTNCYQIIELLYKTESIKKLSPQELTYWLKRSIENQSVHGDEYEQRIENDEDCIKIVTIHKSKGLEYNIVLLPYLDITFKHNYDFATFKNETNNYVFVSKNNITENDKELYKTQLEQENRRLLYVALTRAIYACFIYKNTYTKTSTLSSFTKALPTNSELINITETENVIPENYFYTAQHNYDVQIPIVANNFMLLHNNWSRLSYTGLAVKNVHYKKIPTTVLTNPYDIFIFNELTKGSKTGLMLHQIFETINFTNPDSWPKAVTKAIQNYLPAQATVYEQMLLTLIQHVLQANITIQNVHFNLLNVGYDSRIHEFEFDFTVKPFSSNDMLKLNNEVIQIKTKELYNIEGVMNGKIDMLFECKGKYFVLDWKSTHLGNHVNNYNEAALATSMNDNNYHLQYLIYSLATVKYLQSRLPNFNYDNDFGGVIYLFVRGMRANTNSGIFTCKPTQAQLQILDSILG